MIGIFEVVSQEVSVLTFHKSSLIGARNGRISLVVSNQINTYIYGHINIP